MIRANQTYKTLEEATEAAVRRKVQAYVSWREADYSHADALAKVLENSTFGPKLREDLVNRVSALSFTKIVRTAADFAALNLSMFTLARLSDCTMFVYPHLALPAAIERGQFKGELTLDSLGNFVSFQ